MRKDLLAALAVVGLLAAGSSAMASTVGGSPCPPPATGNCPSGGPWTVNSGTITITGIISVTPYIDLAPNQGDNATIDLQSGGSLTDDIIVGDAGTGTFDNNNSTHNVSGDLILGTRRREAAPIRSKATARSPASRSRQAATAPAATPTGR